MLWLRDGDRGAYLGLQVLVRAEAEGLCPPGLPVLHQSLERDASK